MGLLSGGRVHAGFIGGAEVDKYGNINTSYIGDLDNPKVKLPGSGGAPDIASMAERLIIIINHQKHRLVEKVDFITSPGYLDGGDARKKAGLPGAGPAVIITDRAILRPYGPNNEFHLASVHPGHTAEEVIQNTGWDLRLMPEIEETTLPTQAEMDALHYIENEAFWRS